MGTAETSIELLGINDLEEIFVIDLFFNTNI